MANNNNNQFGGGAPTERQVEEFGAQIEKSKQSPYLLLNPEFVTINGDPNSLESRLATKAANSSKYPIRGFPSDPYDSLWSMKDDLSRDHVDPFNPLAVIPSMVSAKRPLPFTEQDVAYLKRKRDAEENLSYLAWQANKFDLTDPATKNYFANICPSYFDQRDSLIDQQIDLAARYAKLRLRGAKTEDDLKLEYFIETDRISLPKGPIWDPYAWIGMEAGVNAADNVTEQENKILNYNRQAYRKGLFNPTKVQIPQTGGNMQNAFNQGDIGGYPGTHNTGILGAPVSQTKNYALAYGPYQNNRTLFGARDHFNTHDVGAVANAGTNYARIQLANSRPGRTGVGFAQGLQNAGNYVNIPENDVYGP